MCNSFFLSIQLSFFSKHILCSVIDPLLLQAPTAPAKAPGVKHVLLSAALFYHVDVHDFPEVAVSFLSLTFCFYSICSGQWRMAREVC